MTASRSRLDDVGRRRLGNTLRTLRLRAGLTQLQLATASGVHVTSLRDHEQGRSSPTFDTVLRFVRALGISMEQFGQVYDQSPETPPPAKPGRPRRS